MTERGSERSDLASSAPTDQAGSIPNDVDSTAVIDAELLIAEVKKHPILYDNAYTEYIEKVARLQKWNIVCKSLFKQWSEFSVKKKRERIKIVQNKWQKQKDIFFKSYEGDQKHPKSKRSKKNIDSLTFLVPSTVVSDVGVDAGACNTNTDAEYAHISGVMPMKAPLSPEAPPANIPNKSPVPSTSVQTGDFANTYNVQKAPFFIPMPEIGLPPPIDPNPNMHFALMLVPLLNRLNQKELFSAWPKILKVIKDAEGEKRLSILQSELVYPPGVESEENLAEPEPESEMEQEEEKEPVYPSHYGRPTNQEGEIMYPETDHEDLDEA